MPCQHGSLSMLSRGSVGLQSQQEPEAGIHLVQERRGVIKRTRTQVLFTCEQAPTGEACRRMPQY